MEDVPVFRAPKRRKFAKATHAETPPESTTQLHADDIALSLEGPSDDEVPAAIPRYKKPHKSSRLGVTFTSNDRSHAEYDNGLALVPVDTANDRLKDVANRFVGTTGQVVDVDKHMMAYIDSEMAKRRQPAVPSVPPNTAAVESIKTSPEPTDTQPPLPTKEPQRQHQLAEVDLPPDAAMAPPPPKRQRKPRLGRDGKPFRQRRPARRNSSDLARDALVEQVMHEHRLDHYQEPQRSAPAGPASKSTSTIPPTQADAQPISSTGGTADRATPITATTGEARANDDEAFALRFQREFEEGLAERQALQPQRRKKEGPGDKDKDKDKGPRLGGSRSARAKMVAMREAEKEKGKTGRP